MADLTGEKDGGSVIRPSHYMTYGKEVADIMCDIWGPEAVAIWCKLNAFKYRMRMGCKVGVDVTEDLKKEQRCLDMCKKYAEMAGKSVNDIEPKKVGMLFS